MSWQRAAHPHLLAAAQMQAPTPTFQSRHGEKRAERTGMLCHSCLSPDRVGWPWQVRAMSSEEAPYSMASTHSWISSPAHEPHSVPINLQAWPAGRLLDVRNRVAQTTLRPSTHVTCHLRPGFANLQLARKCIQLRAPDRLEPRTRVGAHDGDAQNLVRLGIGNELDHALCVVDAASTAVGHERELAHLQSWQEKEALPAQIWRTNMRQPACPRSSAPIASWMQVLLCEMQQ